MMEELFLIMVSVISNAEFFILTPHVQHGHLQDICPGFGFSDGVIWFISKGFFSLQLSTLGLEKKPGKSIK